MKTTLLAIVGASILALTACTCYLLLTLRSTVAAVPGEIAATRSELVHQVQALRLDALGEIDKQASGIRRDAGAQLTVIRKDALGQVADIAAMADRQFTGTRADLRLTIAQSVDKVVGPLEGVRSDLQPVIANAATLTKDVQDTLDDAYPDVRGLIESSTVAATQLAQTAETVRENAPKFLETAQETNIHIAGVTADVHKATINFTRPRTVKEKIWAGIKTFVLVVPKL